MDISLIIPCHNLENFINPLLVSLQLQVFSNLKAELIFVCDGCSDNTAEKIKAFNFDNYENVKIIEVEVYSCGLARNEGMKEATGELIWFLDGDDWLTYPFAIESVVEFMLKEKNDSKIIKVAYDCPPFFYAKGHPAMVWQYVYRRDLIETIKFSGIQPNEDLVFNQEVGRRVGGFEKIPKIGKPLYYYNFMRSGSNMQQFITKGKIDP